ASSSPPSGANRSGGGGPSGAMVLSTTTSTQDSGLLDVLVPAYEKSSRCVVKTVAVGSGEALTMGEKGDADVLLVHSPDAERAYMAAGHGRSRQAVMHNDFVVVGPPSDQAHVRGSRTAAQALARIARAKLGFASRADDSGTNAKELALWAEAGIEPHGSWYLQTGQGMGATLTIASQKQAYTLTDRGTFLATKGLESTIDFEGSADLRNNYHVIVVKHSGTNTACAKDFARWLLEPSTQRTIGTFGVRKYGQQLFVPDAS
ncbi:MAG: substrate-binding domain-containing protein, partial [Marmoricola sp.]